MQLLELFRHYRDIYTIAIKPICENLQHFHKMCRIFVDSINKLEADVASLRKRIDELEGRN